MHLAPMILHVCTTAMQNPGGLEHLVANLAHYQANRGWAVQALFPQFIASIGLTDLFRQQGVALEFGPSSLRYDGVRTLWHIIRLTQKFR